MREYQLSATTRLVLWQGDLTVWAGDAIVNAANERMLGGGGVDGAIHRAAGPGLVAACRQVSEVRPGVRCPTGEARITPAGNGQLQVRYVIHTVGPVYQDRQTSAPLLASAYASSLALAAEQGLRRIAFPAISCGVYGYPLDEAARIALEACQQNAGRLEEIVFALFSPDAWQAFQAAAAATLAGV
ncbi:MAG: O-acetyl-ADP-ribose deacetylase [Planctomycetota bacterium]|nr:O-acetyl-ADP-ribose deacetylase [Planctomycetota bacterium]